MLQHTKITYSTNTIFPVVLKTTVFHDCVALQVGVCLHGN